MVAERHSTILSSLCVLNSCQAFEGRVRSLTGKSLPRHTVVCMSGAILTHNRQPFNYGDLNWMCLASDNQTYTVQDVAGPDCYQNVPVSSGRVSNCSVKDADVRKAQAYWSDAVRYDRATNGRYQNSAEQREWTMMNDYQPHIIPAQTVWTETMQSIWGASASWFIDGTWDP